MRRVDLDTSVRARAAIALLRLPNETHAGVVFLLLTNDPDAEVRADVADAMRSARGGLLEKHFPEICEALKAAARRGDRETFVLHLLEGAKKAVHTGAPLVDALTERSTIWDF